MIATLYVLVWLSLGFSALQRAENSSMVRRSRAYAAYLEVSVLFSEPKIPQLAMIQRLLPGSATGFSALQRAENSSIQRSGGLRGARPGGFSALQRAENSSIDVAVDESENDAPFQCSSASRKFLNSRSVGASGALLEVSVLFSEPKIPQFSELTHSMMPLWSFCALQRAENSSIWAAIRITTIQFSVSVLFSEPKIPQLNGKGGYERPELKFQCSSASRKFLNSIRNRRRVCPRKFQCSSASRKFLNSDNLKRAADWASVSVLFSEPKIPQFGR